MTFKIQMWLSAHLYELVVCWLIGAAFLLLRFAAGWIFTERLRFNAHVVMDKEWRARFGVITAKMNISKSIEFRETAKILTPMVIGAFSPVVLIPIGLLSGFSTAQVEAILAHELAHIRRNDYLINMFQSFVEVLFFFHPAIWWLSDRIRAEREHCCDDIALAVCGDKMSLAHALVKVAEWQTAPRMAMAFASQEDLKPYHARLQDLYREREKYTFETERLERDIEKIDWKKHRAEELRSDLMEKRSVLFNQDGKESKLSDTELDKQLADFEQQIKAQEQAISDFNNQISNATKEAFKVAEPELKLQREIEEVLYKIDELGKNIGLETLSYRKMRGIDEPPRAPRVARSGRMRRAGTPPFPPPAPVAAPAKVTPAVPAKPAPAPKPPLPPKKDPKD
jgi:uncharacterized coiled-coil protein SlyX